MDYLNGAFVGILILSVLMFFGSILVAWILIVRMPADYLTADPASNINAIRHPVMRVVLQITRNLFGVALVITGIIMLVTPGQGILSIILGLTLIDFPGKHKLICGLIDRPGILKTINRIRARASQPPLEMPTH